MHCHSTGRPPGPARPATAFCSMGKPGDSPALADRPSSPLFGWEADDDLAAAHASASAPAAVAGEGDGSSWRALPNPLEPNQDPEQAREAGWSSSPAGANLTEAAWKLRNKSPLKGQRPSTGGAIRGVRVKQLPSRGAPATRRPQTATGSPVQRRARAESIDAPSPQSTAATEVGLPQPEKLDYSDPAWLCIHKHHSTDSEIVCVARDSEPLRHLGDAFANHHARGRTSQVCCTRTYAWSEPMRATVNCN